MSDDIKHINDLIKSGMNVTLDLQTGAHELPATILEVGEHGILVEMSNSRTRIFYPWSALAAIRPA